MEFIATANRGLEEATAGELRTLGIKILRVEPASVVFEGREEDAWRANLHLRSARRVLMALVTRRVGNAQQLYSAARSIKWKKFLTPETTFAVEASIRDSVFDHSGFVALKVKDAIADSMRDSFGARANVDRNNPDLRVMVRVAGKRCDISLDTSGAPLHKRGYRKKGVPGMLNESVAAGLLLTAGYEGALPFYDPFCGAGTIAVEAALIAARVAPGLLAPSPFGFERRPGFDANRWRELLEEARGAIREPPMPLFASDISDRAVKAAVINAAEAGVGGAIRFERGDARRFEPAGEPGIIVTNPPYGDDSGEMEQMPELYADFGSALKRRCAGFSAWILDGNDLLRKSIGLKPERRLRLHNGPKACTLIEYRLFAGSLREEKQRH